MEPAETRELDGAAAESVAETLAALGLYDGEPSETFDEQGRDALEAFCGLHSFENHSLAVVEDALARDWSEADGGGEDRMVDAIWHGLQAHDRV